MIDASKQREEPAIGILQWCLLQCQHMYWRQARPQPTSMLCFVHMSCPNNGFLQHAERILHPSPCHVLYSCQARHALLASDCLSVIVQGFDIRGLQIVPFPSLLIFVTQQLHFKMQSAKSLTSTKRAVSCKLYRWCAMVNLSTYGNCKPLPLHAFIIVHPNGPAKTSLRLVGSKWPKGRATHGTFLAEAPVQRAVQLSRTQLEKLRNHCDSNCRILSFSALTWTMNRSDRSSVRPVIGSPSQTWQHEITPKFTVATCHNLSQQDRVSLGSHGRRECRNNLFWVARALAGLALAAFKGPCVEACEDMFFQIAQLLAPQHLATLLWQQEHLDIMILHDTSHWWFITLESHACLNSVVNFCHSSFDKSWEPWNTKITKHPLCHKHLKIEACLKIRFCRRRQKKVFSPPTIWTISDIKQMLQEPCAR